MAVGFLLHTMLVMWVALTIKRTPANLGAEGPLLWWLLVVVDFPSSSLYVAWYAILSTIICDSNMLDASFFLVIGGAQYALLFALVYAAYSRFKRKSQYPTA